MKDSCKKCRYFEHTKYIRGVEVEEGVCRRFPPNLKDSRNYNVGQKDLWPLVSSLDWCGEFKNT